MSAFVFRLDASGHVAGGEAVCGTLSEESWRLTACPVRSLEETGFVIAWPNGERWEHDHIAGVLPDAGTERAA